MTIPQHVQSAADRVVTLSLIEARQLPNLLGRIAPVMLAQHGFYAATVGGVKTLYVRAS